MEAQNWETDPEIKAELEAMAGFSAVPDLQLSDSSQARKVKKRKSKSGIKKVKKVKEKKSTSVVIGSIDQIELVNIIKQPAFTSEEKYKVLEARDKLIRLRMKRNTDITLAKHIVGTCPDMCPEKERLMREVQHQVSLYEQESGEKNLNPFLAVKQYSRSSADQEVPLPHELRPVAVLQRTMSYLLHKIVDLCDNPDINLGEWYHFLWDRTRGIRKDITQQELCCKGAAELVEQCARFHIHCSARLVAEDASVFDQKINTENLTKCLQTLKYMYHDLEVKNESCPNEPEFRAYVILLNLNDANFMWEVQQLRREIQKSKEVQFALQAYSALDKNNYVKFFNLVRSTSYLNACILLRYFVQVRFLALRTIIKSYSPRFLHTHFPLDELKHILAFEGRASTIDFVEYHGLRLNENRTHIVLDKKSFQIPEFSYTLDRAMNVIESKRQGSVGEVICGNILEDIDFETFIPHDSFDVDGFLNVKEYLPDIDLDVLPRDSEKSAKTEVEDKPGEVVPKSGQTSAFHSSIFALKSSSESRSNSPMDTVDRGGSDTKVETATIWNKPEKTTVTSIFAKSDSVSRPKSIFHVPAQTKASSSMFAPAKPGSIFAQPQKQVENKPAPAKSAGIPSNIFRPIPTVTDPPKVFNIFAGTKPAPGFFAQSESTGSQRKSGGFTFNLNTPLAQQQSSRNTASTFGPPRLGAPHKIELKRQIEEAARLQENLEEKIRMENERRKRLEDERRQRKLAAEKEEENRRRAEAEIARRKLEEEARRKKIQETERRKLEEERKRVAKAKELERKRRKTQEMEERRLSEIRTAVRNLMEDVIIEVETHVRDDKLASISRRVKLKKASFYFTKWKNCVLINKRKRKAIDQWPIWVNSTTVREEAHELYSHSQDEALKYMKRYKNGVPVEIPVDFDMTVEKIDIAKLTRRVLARNFRGSPIKPRRNYLKIDVFVASLSYMTTNLKWIEKVINEFFDWKDNDYELVEEGRMLNNRVKFSIKRKQSFKYDSADGYVFIGDELGEEFYSDVKKIVESSKILSELPVAILLQNDDYDRELLDELVCEGKISQYKVYAERYTPKSLIFYLETALIYLSERAAKPPPLELDTLRSFLHKHLATEVWKRMSSFTKWNEPYRLCLTKPEIVISLYNEALTRLESIIFDANSLEYPDFPEIFQDDSEDLPVLPCDYKHFPQFWKNNSYRGKLKRILADLTLPKFQTKKWPPNDAEDLELMIGEFCGKFYRNPTKKAYRIVASILESFDVTEDFADIKNVLWSEIVEVLISEKLKEIDFSLREPFVSVYDELFVVYNKDDLSDYNTSTWFYLHNPIIKKEIDFDRYPIEEGDADVIQAEDEEAPVGIDNVTLETSLLQVAQERYDREEKISDSKNDLREFEMLMADLEQSMAIQKQIGRRFEDILSRALIE